MNITPTIEQIFEKYRDKMYRLAWSICRNEKDAEDIIQNALLKIVEHLKAFRRESNIATWIYKITYNEALMFLRKKRSASRLSQWVRFQPPQMRGTVPGLPDKKLLDQELKERLQTGINAMPIKYRMPLLLSKVEDLSLRENAQILNLRIPSLKTRLHRAFLMLKEEIDAYFNDRGTSSRLEPDGCCRKMTDFLYEYARQRIADKKKHPFDPHLKDCPACRLFFKRYLKAIQLTHSLQCRDMPEELKQRIVKFFKGKC